MSNSINSCHLSGNLGKDPESSYLPSGTMKATFSIAINEEWKDRTTQEKKKKTSWVNIEVFGATAEKFVMPYIHKGDEVYVEGKLEIRTYSKDGGPTQYYTSIKAEKLKILKSKNSSNVGSEAPADNTSDYEGPDTPPEDDIPF